MRHFSKNIALLLIAFSTLLMGFSPKLTYFEKVPFLTSNTDEAEVPNYWMDYFLIELADTGEELPQKHLEEKEEQTGFRKKSKRVAFNAPSRADRVAFFSPDFPQKFTLATSNAIPLPGYYASLHLFHLF